MEWMKEAQTSISARLSRAIALLVSLVERRVATALKNWLVLVVRVGSEGPRSEIEEICHESVVSIWTFGLNVVEEGNMAQVHILVEVGHELSFLTHARAVIVKR